MQKIQFLRLAPWMGISRPHPQNYQYEYTVAQVVSILDKRLFHIDFIDGVIENLTVDGILERINGFRPETLALTTTSNTASYDVEIFKRTKKLFPDLYLIAFGQLAHYDPDTFLNQLHQIDACVYGEPEDTLVELIEKRPRKSHDKVNIPGIYFWDSQVVKTPERELRIDLDEWPMPAYEIFKGIDYRIISAFFPTFRNIRGGWVLTSRGCPYKCTFCSPAIRRSHGSRLRKNSPRRVAETFEFLHRELKLNTINIADNAFTLDMAWAEDVADELIKSNNRIQWFMGTRADKLSSGLIAKLKAAGVVSAGVGVETGFERVMRDIKKGLTLEQIEWAVAEYKKHKLSVSVSAIVGHVDETIEELEQTFDFLKKINPTFVQLHYLTPYPGTEIAEVFKERLEGVKDMSHYNTRPINFSKIPDDILQGSLQKFYRDYYISWRYLKKYINERLPYSISNPVKEITLIKESLSYFFNA